MNRTRAVVTGADQTDWWVLEIDCPATLAKAALWRLSGPGHRCCVVRRNGKQTSIQAFLSRASVTHQDLAEFYIGLLFDAAARGLEAPDVEWQVVDSWEWPEDHRQGYQPIPIGRHLLIQQHWMATDTENRTAIRLDARYGFGAGTHQTTQLALEALERRLENSLNQTIADIGCGCGVQSVAAVKLGARHVYAVDTKSASVVGTIRNRELNEIPANRLTAAQGSVARLQQMLPQPVDGFVCNILSNIILGLIPRFANVSSSQTWGILSGIREGEITEIEESLANHDWKATSVVRQDGWCCVEIGRT